MHVRMVKLAAANAAGYLPHEKKKSILTELLAIPVASYGDGELACSKIAHIMKTVNTGKSFPG